MIQTHDAVYCKFLIDAFVGFNVNFQRFLKHFCCKED